MKRSEINAVCQAAAACFHANGWHLPPKPAWDVTDFGRGRFEQYGLVLVNLATEPEYCEKLMYARRGQLTPCHTHRHKKEDIICRAGRLRLRLWHDRPGRFDDEPFCVQVNGQSLEVRSGHDLVLEAGSRVTLVPGVWHEFAPLSAECVIGEVSTANDDLHDNFFLDASVGRFPPIEEDEAPAVRLLSER
ncbi:MAG: D-lyxose/D-mannose family sugar isomerase [Verrucomicrobiota bacterium JB022]|nr:D-lyxose/D-mannose family sugar isomerase [Verrucomicrobiota bacterium JB022]